MAIIRGLAVSLTTPQGDRLPLFSPDAKITDMPQPPNSLMKYVQAEPRAEFHVRLGVKSEYNFGRATAIAFQICLEGRPCCHQVLTRAAYGAGDEPWFSEIKEYSSTGRNGSQQVCKLEFKSLTIFNLANKSWHAEAPSVFTNTVSVNVLPGTVDQLGNFVKDPNREALASFLFRCRTPDQLETLDLDPFTSRVPWVRALGRGPRPEEAHAEMEPELPEPTQEDPVNAPRRHTAPASLHQGDLASEPQRTRNSTSPTPSSRHQTDEETGDLIVDLRNSAIPDLREDTPMSGGDGDGPMPSIEHDGTETWDMMPPVQRDEGRHNNQPTRAIQEIPDSVADEDEDFEHLRRSHSRRPRSESIELGRTLDIDAPAIKQDPGAIIKPEPANDRTRGFAHLSPMEQLAARRQQLLETFDQMQRDLTVLTDGDHEKVKAGFEKRARIRAGKKQLQTYFTAEDEMREAQTAPERPNRYANMNLIDLTEDSDMD